MGKGNFLNWTELDLPRTDLPAKATNVKDDIYSASYDVLSELEENFNKTKAYQDLTDLKSQSFSFLCWKVFWKVSLD